MDVTERRRARLAQLLDLAQTYRHWTRKDLARALGRDPTKLIPGTGIPKLDLVVELSTVLEWPVGDVVAFLYADEPPLSPGNGAATEFESLDVAARDAHRQGKYSTMVEIAREAFECARTAEDRARACNREAGGWDGLGRYGNVLGAIQRGLIQTPVSSELRRMLQANLANAYYSLWQLVEARSVAADLLKWYEQCPPSTVRDRKTNAFAHYVFGHTQRRLVNVEPDRATELATSALRHLECSRSCYSDLALELNDVSFSGIANTCCGGIVEVQVELGKMTVQDALEFFSNGLEEASVDVGGPVGDKLESYGWWCIFGCNLALRHLTDERSLQHYMAIFTNKADEIAEKLDNWAIRERVFTMEHSRWERAVGCTGFDIPRVVDEEDVRIIAGTMARFPTFQATGWQILRSARVIRS